jgi:hypothetical protein
VVGIVLFGIAKEFGLVWYAYQQNIMNQNPNVEFRVSMLTNKKRHEIAVPIESVRSIQSKLLLWASSSSVILSQQGHARYDQSKRL